MSLQLTQLSSSTLVRANTRGNLYRRYERAAYRQLILGEPETLSGPTLWALGAGSVVLCGVALGVFGPVFAALTIIGVLASYVLLRYPAVGGYLIAAVVPIASGLTRGFPVPGLRLSELIVGFASVMLLATARRERTNKWNAIDWTLFVYAIAMIVFAVGHLVAKGDDATVSVISPMLLPLQFFLIYRSVRIAVPSVVQRDFALKLVLLASLIVDAIAVLQQLNIGPTRSFVYRITSADALESYGYQHWARATGPFQHWHPLAGYLVVIVLITVSLLLLDETSVMSRKGLYVVLGGALSALALSVTFVALFGVVVGVLYLALRAGRIREAVIAMVGFGIAGMVAFGSFFLKRITQQYSTATGQSRNSWIPQTVQYRFDVWAHQYLPSIGGRWIAGYGPTLPDDAIWTHTESVYITLALRGGIPLIALFVISMIAVSSVARRMELDPTRVAIARALIALVGALWIMHFLFPYFTSSGMPQPFWVLVGICTAGYQLNSWKSSRDDREKEGVGPWEQIQIQRFQ